MHELLQTAKILVSVNPYRPRQADLRKAVSSGYYALFHTLASECANRFIGHKNRLLSEAWHQVYRSLEHNKAKEACRQVLKLGFPAEIIHFADIFCKMQDARHKADYDPFVRYSRADVLLMITEVESALKGFKSTPKSDRTAFSALVLLKKRG
jgi:uncharacterized protein (UPF0332 family)